MKKFVPFFLWLFLPTIIFAQSQPKPSSELYDDLQRFANTATVMYVAAHPDDENTRMISWLTHSKHVNTVYLSLTRGDGGQNLIGTEKGDLLGLLRTQELLEARNVDKGNQWFTRANDFGYSKTATETLEIWDEKEILADVVWAIRLHRPDVMITRFDPDSNGKTHGHHTASAMLAVEAFDLAGDPTAYPEQLKYVDAWQPRRLFFNTSWWFYGSKENFEQADKSDMVSMDVGEYYPALGISNNEIASMSRSKHACQGFGSALQRGSQIEWLQLLKGDMPTNGDFLQGIDNSWNRYAPEMGNGLSKIIENYDFLHPEKTAEELLVFRRKNIQSREKIPAPKHKAFRELVLDLFGVYTEWVTSTEQATQGEEITTTLEISNRSSKAFASGFGKEGVEEGNQAFIQPNESVKQELPFTIGEKAHKLYWLTKPKDGIGMYTVEDQEMVGLPQEGPKQEIKIPLFLGEENLTISVPLQHKTVNPAKGELYEPFYVVPPVAVNFSDPVYLFAENEAQEIKVEVTAFTNNVKGEVQLDAGLDWMIGQSKPFSIAHKGGKQTLTFKVIPPKKQMLNTIKASAKVDGKSYFDSFTEVNYDHIDKQFVFQPAQAKIGKIEMNVPDKKVLYIQGSGDEVPKSLRQVGVSVTELDTDTWTSYDFTGYDVVLVGIRAFNVMENASLLADDLKTFAEKGGTVIVQYQTSRGLNTDNFAPYELKLGRGRISQEDAALKILQPNHAVFTTPNQITQKDFDGWVQERGLYFGSEWATEFTPLMAGNDTGEDEKQGMLLVAPIGEGQFVYTGLSFFRELPAGVPGAYRLFMNLLALE